MISVFDATKSFDKWFDNVKKSAFFSAIIAGIFAHFTIIGEQILCPDGLVSAIRYSGSFAEMAMGRWVPALIGQFWPDRETHAMVVPLCILYAALAAMLICDVFQIKSSLSGVVVGISFSIAPALTVLMYYSFVAAKYEFAMLVAVFAAWLVWKLKKPYKYVIPGILIMFSLATYQAYLGMVTGVAVILTIVAFLVNKNPEDNKRSFRLFIDYVISCGIGVVLYFISLKVMKLKWGIEVSYNNASNFTLGYIIKNFFHTIFVSYKDFARYFFADGIVKNTVWHRDVFFMILAVLMAVNVLLLLVTNRKKENLAFRILACVLCALFPAAANVCDIITMGSGIYQLTSMPLILIPIFGLVLLENTDFSKIKVSSIITWTETVVVSAVLITYMFATVFSHMYMKMQFDQIETIALRVMDRMETTEGYYPGMPVCIIGVPNHDEFVVDTSYMEYDLGGIVDVGIFHEGVPGAVLQSWGKIFTKYLGTSLPIVDGGTMMALNGREEFLEMESFPGATSVQIIDGIMVVKFSSF